MSAIETLLDVILATKQSAIVPRRGVILVLGRSLGGDPMNKVLLGVTLLAIASVAFVAAAHVGLCPFCPF